MDEIIKMVNSLENSDLLVHGTTETVKHKKEKGGYYGAMITLTSALLIAPIASSLIQPVVDSLINAISGKVVMRPEKRREAEFLPLLTLPLMIKAMT